MPPLQAIHIDFFFFLTFFNSVGPPSHGLPRGTLVSSETENKVFWGGGEKVLSGHIAAACSIVSQRVDDSVPTLEDSRLLHSGRRSPLAYVLPLFIVCMVVYNGRRQQQGWPFMCHQPLVIPLD